MLCAYSDTLILSTCSLPDHVWPLPHQMWLLVHHVWSHIMCDLSCITYDLYHMCNICHIMCDLVHCVTSAMCDFCHIIYDLVNCVTTATSYVTWCVVWPQPHVWPLIHHIWPGALCDLCHIMCGLHISACSGVLWMQKLRSLLLRTQTRKCLPTSRNLFLVLISAIPDNLP